MKFEYYSNVAFVTAVVVYLIAMSAHALEWAAARKVVLDEPAVVDQPALVGVAAQSVDRVGSVGDADVRDTGVRRDTDVRDADSARPVSPHLGSSRPASPPTESDGTEPEGTESAGTVSLRHGGSPLTVDQRVDTFGRVGISLTVVGFVLSLAGVVMRAVAAQRAPWGNMFEFTTSAMVLVVAVYLVMVFRTGARWLGLPVTLLATVGNGLAVTVFYVAVAPLVPALHSVWFLIHIIAAAISGAAFNVGGIASVLYLLKKRAEGRGEVRGYLARLPSAQRMDVTAYRFFAFAFPLWTFTVAAGAVWAQYAWGRYWGWDPKETWALITWIIYACYLHARSTAGWKGRRAAVLAIVGLGSFWFNFIGINLLVSGLHSYAGV